MSGGAGNSDGYHQKLSAPLLVLGLIGFGVSLYALLMHIESATSGGAALGCDINDVFNCSNVLAGEYGSLFGIPLGGYGMAFFAILMGAASLPLFARASLSWHARMRLLITGVGAAVSVGLAILSYFVLESVCSVCSGVHLTCLVAFVYAAISWVKVRGLKVETDGHAFTKFVSTSLVVSVPALLAGFLGPFIAPQILESSADASGQAQLDMTQTPVPETVLGVSKSRFVGKGEDFRKGSDDAKVVIQMFSDFQCPHCAVSAEAIEKAMANVGEDKVLFVYRNYPLSSTCNTSIGSLAHAQACQLAEAARCAGQQGKFWEMKEWAFELIGASQDQLKTVASEQGLSQKAAEFGLNQETFDACMNADTEMNKIRDDIRIANELGIQGTPLLVVNNRVYTGPRSPEALSSLFQSLAARPE